MKQPCIKIIAYCFCVAFLLAGCRKKNDAPYTGKYHWHHSNYKLYRKGVLDSLGDSVHMIYTVSDTTALNDTELITSGYNEFRIDWNGYQFSQLFQTDSLIYFGGSADCPKGTSISPPPYTGYYNYYPETHNATVTIMNANCADTLVYLTNDTVQLVSYNIDYYWSY